MFASLDMIYEAELEAAYAKSRCLHCLANKEEKEEEAAQYRTLEAKEGTRWAWMNYKPVKIKKLNNSPCNKPAMPDPSTQENNTHATDMAYFYSTTIPCTCYKFRAEAVRASGNGGDINEARSKFLTARDACLACQHEIPRTIKECSCQEARTYHLSLLKPQAHSIFPTQEQIREASFDAYYERTRCLYCKCKKPDVDKDEENETPPTPAPGLKKLKIKRHAKLWKMENGQPYKMTEFVSELVNEAK